MSPNPVVLIKQRQGIPTYLWVSVPRVPAQCFLSVFNSQSEVGMCPFKAVVGIGKLFKDIQKIWRWSDGCPCKQDGA